MTFNYGTTLPDSKSDFKLWPEEGEFTALIDGDMIPYIVAYTVNEHKAYFCMQAARKVCEQNNEGEPITQEWFEALCKQPYFKERLQHLHTVMNSWVTGCGADSAKIYLTGSTNYRIDTAFTKPYKGQRKSQKPPFFYELRYYVLNKYNARLSVGNEADDEMSIEQWRDTNSICGSQGTTYVCPVGSEQHKVFASTCIVSKDKDLRIVAGWNYEPDSKVKSWTTYVGQLEPIYKDKEVINYETWYLADGHAIHPDKCSDIKLDRWSRGAKKGQIKTKRVRNGMRMDQVLHKLKGFGQKFFYAQMIMGDTVDNYDGIKGAGLTLAFDTLNHLESVETMEEAVYNAFCAKLCGGTTDSIWVDNYRGGRQLLTPWQLMIEQGRLAHMQTYSGDIWRSAELQSNVFGREPINNIIPSGIDKGAWI